MAAEQGPYRAPTLTAPRGEPRRVPVGGIVACAVAVFTAMLGGSMGGACILTFVAFVGLPALLVQFARGQRTSARWMLVEGAILLAGALWVLRASEGARARALANEARIIPAVDRYRADTGRYPERLDELVPRYLPSTHPAGRTGAYRITYWRYGGSALLVTTVVPPYGRRTWNFKEHRAGFLD